MKRVSLIVATVLAGSLAAWGWSVARATATDDDAIGMGVGYRPPPFSGVDMAGTRHRLADYRGSVLVLHFWASWCPYCRSEVEELVPLHRERRQDKVRVLTVSTDKDLQKLREFISSHQLPYPVIVDAEAERSIADQYGIGGIPVTYVLSPDGRIAARLQGASDITKAVNEAVAALPASGS